MKKYIFPVIIGTIALVQACTNDKLPEPDPCSPTPTYDVEIKPIFDASCAYTGCHVSGGIGPGDYSNYESISGLLDQSISSFRNRVFDLREDPALGMPPNNSVYSISMKDDLTPEELELLDCWLRAGYPKN